MLEDVLESFVHTLFTFITSKQRFGRTSIIRKHSEALDKLGDFSFPAKLNPWLPYLTQDKTSSLHETILQSCRQSDLVEKSTAWCLQIVASSEKLSRINLSLNRAAAAKIGIVQCRTNSEKINVMLTNKRIKIFEDISDRSVDSLTNYRVAITSGVINKLVGVCCSDDVCVPGITVTCNSSREAPAGWWKVCCGPVINASTGLKETTLSAQDYIEKRQNEMTLIAQHRYGVRASADQSWSCLVRRLGEAAVAYELLQVRPGNPVKINFQHPSAGCSKGAAFVLYNCARLQTLVATFQQKVDTGQYPPPPDIEHTDFALLTDEDEWSLLFNYVLGFPGVLRGCLRTDGVGCVASPHLLCAFLSSLVRTFSQYYRRVRILTEARAHLMPVLFARLRLLAALEQTLTACLHILNIPAVSQM